MKHIILFFAILLVCVGKANAQSAAMQRATDEFNKFHYADASKMFEALMTKEGASLEAKEKLATCYLKMNDSKNAERWLALVVNESADPMFKLYYAQVLAQNQKYAESREWYEKFAIAMKSDKRGKEFAVSYTDVEKFFKDVERYTVELAPFNSKDADFSPAYYMGGIVFCSNRPRDDKKNKLVHKWTGKRFLDLYYAVGAGPKAKPFSDKLNTQYHEGSSTFYNDGASIIFTRNNFHEGKFGKSSEDINKLKLFFAQKGSGDWVNITEFPFNDAEYSIAHPTLSPDGQILYFTSDMPGSIGETDIWMCKATAGGGWSAPINLGKEVNTKGKESFPYIDARGDLFFSSDGHAGLGGLDIFVTRADKKGKYSLPQNIGAPINSNKDDFSLIFDTESNEGYFSSNREGGVGDDDIYKFSIKVCEVFVTVVDAVTGKGIPDVKLSVTDKQTKSEAMVSPETDTTFFVKSNYSSGYNIIATKEKYSNGKSEISEQLLAKCKQTGGRLQDTVRIRMYPSNISPIDPNLANLLGRNPKEPFGKNPDGSPILNNPYKPTRPPVFRGNPNVKIIDVLTIYYDLDKYNIRPDAERDLQRVLKVLYEYPNMVISMSSHTDSRDSFDYNVKLAQNRAKSAMSYLIERGIDANRLEISSFGEIKLTNNCPDGIDCTEPEHQLNRRTEIMILSISE